MKNVFQIRERLTHWARFQQIVSILAKHGFTGFLSEMGFGSSTTADQDQKLDQRTIPRQLRLAFEELGPTFIKLGQLLSTRPDLLPPTYIDEFAKLTDHVPGFQFSEAKSILEKEFGRDFSEIYEWIEESPLAAASIAQVHRAILKENQQKVVIKIQRPGIKRTIQSDIQVLYVIARALERIREEFRLMNLTAIVKEFQRSVMEELDFTLEARNIDSFQANFPSLDAIIFPSVIWSATTSKILTMSEINGTTLTKVKDFPETIDRHALAEQLATFFLESMFFHGLFHADAHLGNLLLVNEGSGKIAVLDFGMVGTLPPELRAKLSKLFLALITQDFESLAAIYTEVGEFGKAFSLQQFQRDVTDFLRPHLGKKLNELKVGQILLDSTVIARKYKVRLPRDLIMFYRSLVTLENVGRKLDPQFDFLTYGQKFGQSLVRRRFSSEELLKDLFRTIEGLRSLGTELPTQVRTLMRKVDAMNFPSHTSASDEMRLISRQNALSFLTFGFILSASLISGLRPESPMILPLWIAAGVSVFLLLLLLFKKRSH